MTQLNRPAGNRPAGKTQKAEVVRVRKGPVFAIVGAVLAVILAAAGFFYYGSYVAPFKRTVITSEKLTVRMDYFLDRARLSGSDALSTLSMLTNEMVVKLGAPQYGISVSAEDVDKALRRAAQGDSESISESEFKEWYRQQRNASRLSDSQFREMVSYSIMESRLRVYLADLVPTVGEQVHLHAIALGSEREAQKIKEGLTAGDDFAAVAREVSLDQDATEKGGDMGWIPRGVTIFDEVAFDLKVGEISEVLPYSDPSGTSDPSSQGTAPPVYYFLLKVSEKADSKPLDEEDLDILRGRALEDWLAVETSRHDIKYVNFNSETMAWISWQLAKNKPASSGDTGSSGQ